MVYQSNLPPIWKPIVGKGLTGTLVEEPRTIRGVVVIDVVDYSGKRWTSPTVSKMSEHIVKAMNRTPLREGDTVKWICEGLLKSRKGNPHHEFSVCFKDKTGQVIYEHQVLSKQTVRKKVVDGTWTLQEALDFEEALAKENVSK